MQLNVILPTKCLGEVKGGGARHEEEGVKSNRDDSVREELRRKQEAKYKNTPRVPENVGRVFQTGLGPADTGKQLWQKLSDNWYMLVENCVDLRQRRRTERDGGCT